MTTPSSYLSLVQKDVALNGVTLQYRGTLNIVAPGATAGDSEQDDETTITLAGLPEGGTEGQFITVDSNGDIVWVTVAPGAADAESIRGIPIDASVGSAGETEDTYVITYSHGTGFVLAAGGSGGGYATIQNNGTPVTTRTILNLPTGCGLVAADDTVSKTTLTVSGLTTTHLSASANIAASQIAAGSAGTVLAGGSPNAFTASPSVTSLTASSFVAAGGGTLADAGAVRMAATARIANRNNGNTANNTTGWTSDVWDVSAGATKLLSVGATTVAIEAAATLGFAAGITSATITQAAAADAVGQNLTVRAQGNNSATLAAGNLVLGGGVNAGAGADGNVQIETAGTTRVTVTDALVTSTLPVAISDGTPYLRVGGAPGSGAGVGAASTGALRLHGTSAIVWRQQGDAADGASIQSTSSNVLQLTAAAGIVLANGVTANSSITASGTVQGAGLTSSAANVQWSNGVNGILRIFPRTSGTPNKLTIQGQDNTGGAGGDVLFRAGQGTTSDGNIALHADPASWNGMGRGLFVGNRSAAPTGNPADGGYLYAESGDIYWRSSSGVTTQLN